MLVADTNVLLEPIFKHGMRWVNGAYNALSLTLRRFLTRSRFHVKMVHAVLAIWCPLAGTEARALRDPEKALWPL